MENVDWRHLTTGSSGLTGQARSQLNRMLEPLKLRQPLKLVARQHHRRDGVLLFAIGQRRLRRMRFHHAACPVVFQPREWLCLVVLAVRVVVAHRILSAVVVSRYPAHRHAVAHGF